MLFAEDEGVDVVGGQFDAVAVSDGIGRAGFYAVPTEDAAGIVDIVDFCIPLSRGDSLGFRIFRRFNVDTICGAGGGTKKAANTFLKTVFIALEDMDPPVARLNAGGDVWKALRRGFAEHGPQRDAKAFEKRHKRFTDFPSDGWHQRSL